MWVICYKNIHPGTVRAMSENFKTQEEAEQVLKRNRVMGYEFPKFMHIIEFKEKDQ
jgi:hypothetical protein